MFDSAAILGNFIDKAGIMALKSLTFFYIAESSETSGERLPDCDNCSKAKGTPILFAMYLTLWRSHNITHHLVCSSGRRCRLG